jgi:hypothetical protein
MFKIVQKLSNDCHLCVSLVSFRAINWRITITVDPRLLMDRNEIKASTGQRLGFTSLGLHRDAIATSTEYKNRILTSWPPLYLVVPVTLLQKVDKVMLYTF